MIKNDDLSPLAAWGKLVVFALPSIGFMLLVAPVGSVLVGVYAEHFGLSLTSMAGVLLIARLFDAVTDPIIGYMSDRRRMQTGSRKELIAVGGVSIIFCVWFLYVPPQDVGLLYFCFWSVAFYAALTLYSIPLTAWASEFAVDANAKLRVFSLVAGAAKVGSALFYVLPFLPMFTSTEINPALLKACVFVGAPLFLASLFISLRYVPDGPRPISVSTDKDGFLNASTFRSGVNSLVSTLWQNKPFLIFISAYLCLGMSTGMWSGLFYIFVGSFLKQGEHYALISIWGLLAGAVAIPAWYRLSKVYGKRKSWLVGVSVLMAVFLVAGFLQPEISGVIVLSCLNVVMMFSVGSMAVIVAPMFCDVIDYGRLKDDAVRNGLYFSLQTLMAKFEFALGSALGIAIVGWFGFDPQAQEQSDLSVFGLRMGVAWVPVFFAGLTMLFVAKMPLTEERMEVVHRRLAQRAERTKHALQRQ